MNYTEIESKVREATNDEQWGPTGAQMQEISQHTFSYESFPEVMGMLWKRMLQDNRSNWRRTYKSLLLLQYLVRNGSERVVTSAREHIYDLRSLENYTYIDEVGKDCGVNVRNRARQIIDFIQDDEKLREERKKAKKNKDKYIGVAAHSMMGSAFRSGSSYSGGYSDSYEANEPSEYEETGHKASPIDNRPDSPPKQPLPTKANSPVPHSPVPRPATSKNSIVRKSIDPSKKIDLGAAAHYKGENQNTSSSLDRGAASAGPTNADLLGDIFAVGTPVTGVTSVGSPLDDFTPFEAAIPPPGTTSPLPTTNAFMPSTVPGSNDDEFADFTSAFSSLASPSSPTNLQTPQPPLAKSNQSAGCDLFGEPILQASGPSSLISPGAGIHSVDSFNSLPFIPSPTPVTGHQNANASALMQQQLTSQLAASTLQPIKANSSSHGSSGDANRGTNDNNNKSLAATGSTWANLASAVNINVDNLLGSKYETKPAPSMNQLAAARSTARVAPTVNNTAQAGFFSPTSTSPSQFF